MEEGYRVPEIGEFVQGFEFERLERRGGGSWFFVNMTLDEGETKNDITCQIEKNKQPTIEEWVPMKVWWKPAERTLLTSEYNGVTYTEVINPLIHSPISEEWMIENKRVRVKI